MSPNQREREYERRRYDKWQEKLEAKKAQRAQRNRTLGAVAAAIGVVAIAFGVVWLARGDDTDVAPVASDATTSPETSTATDADNPCGPTTATDGSGAASWDEAPAVGDTAKHTYELTLVTSCGDITVELDGAKAPTAVASTVFLAEKGFYDNTPCHRLTTQGIYVLQCGDPTGSGSGGPGYTYGPVENAPKDQVYPAGTVAMARASAEDSQGSQFFLVYQDSSIPGDYTVLGEITEGLDVVQNVADGGVAEDTGDGAPLRPISIVSASVTEK